VRGSLSIFRGVVKYFGSEWSFTHFRLPDPSVRSICAFGQEKNSVMGAYPRPLCSLAVADAAAVVCSDGSWFKYLFDIEKGGECKQDTAGRFYQADAALPAGP
jgi:hypothetical protein